MNKEITVVLPVEVKNRAFDSRLLLAYRLIKEGYKVIIGDRSGCAREINFIQNCIYLAKSLAYSQSQLFKKIKHNNGRIFILYEEGGYIGREKHKFSEIRSSYPKKMLHFVDSIFVYGKSFQNFLVENLPEFNSRNTYVIGNSRFDLHKPKYLSYYSKQVNKIKSIYGNYLLFNGNFNFGNHYLGENYILNEIINNKEITEEFKENYLIQKIEHSKAYLNNFLDLIKYIAQKLPKQTIIVRPHPGENIQIYRRTLKNIKNLFIINEGAATPWIIGSKLVIHLDCTTAIESIFAEKPVISYIPFEDTSDLFWLSVYVSDIAKTKKEVLNKIHEYLSVKKDFGIDEKKKSVLCEEIINFSEETSKLFVNFVNETTRNMNLVSKKQLSTKNIISINLKKIYLRGRNIAGWIIGKYIKKTGYCIKYEGVSKKEVKSKLGIFKQIHEDSFDYNISRLGINTFKIECKS
ncbi:MAG: hypothetical protein KJI71_02665 [Patescibacteria group bacterium]|nr:hypothetical protein [Patescibacteria group bacterium]